jgi:Zn-dependent peptidase ImmA (M78 family)
MHGTTQEFIGDRLRLARLMQGCTLQEVGEAASVTRQNIHQLESGTRAPSEDVLSALAEFLKVEESFFFSPLNSEVKPEQCHFRKRKTTPVGVANRVLAYSTLFEQLVEFIREKIELPPNDFDIAEKLGFDTRDLSPNKIEDLAEAVRIHWGLRIDCPINDMANVLESAGAVVTCFEGLSERVDALSVKRQFPLVIRNMAKESACRMRFDLAHECGHLIMHDGVETGDKKTESQANSFASAFLMPRAVFTQEFAPCVHRSRLVWNHLYHMKLRWKTSVRAIVYRAHYLGLLTAQQYRSANVQLNRSGQARFENYDDLVQMEEPHILKTAFNLLYDELHITFEGIAQRLGISRETLSQLTGLPIPEQMPSSNVVPLRA